MPHRYGRSFAYALFLLLIPGLLVLCFNLVPFFNRGSKFQVHPDGSVSVRRASWEPLREYQYSTVTADGTTIEFTPPPVGPPAIVLPGPRVLPRIQRAAARQGVVRQQQLHRTPKVTDAASGRLESCSW